MPFKERGQTLPAPQLFFRKKSCEYFSPSSDGIFSWTFFKTTSTDWDLLIPRVFDEIQSSCVILACLATWRLASNVLSKRDIFSNSSKYRGVRFKPPPLTPRPDFWENGVLFFENIFKCLNFFGRGTIFWDRLRKWPKFSGASRQNISILPLNMVPKCPKFFGASRREFFLRGVLFFAKIFNFFARGTIFCKIF